MSHKIILSHEKAPRPPRFFGLVIVALAISISVCVAESSPFLSAFSKSLTVVHVADLPRWSGDAKALAWLNADDFHSTAAGPPPDVRLGVTRQNQVLYEYSMNDPGESLPLLAGWRITMENSNDCLSIDYALEHPQKGHHLLEVRHNRTDIWLSRAMSCIGGTATIFYTIVLNDRYLAFMTSEPGLRFFDMRDGVVLPLVVLDNPNHFTNVYLSPDGEVLVEIQVNDEGKTNARWVDRQADGVRRVVFEGNPLVGAPVPEVVTELKILNQSREQQKAAKYLR